MQEKKEKKANGERREANGERIEKTEKAPEDAFSP